MYWGNLWNRSFFQYREANPRPLHERQICFLFSQRGIPLTKWDNLAWCLALHIAVLQCHWIYIWVAWLRKVKAVSPKGGFSWTQIYLSKLPFSVLGGFPGETCSIHPGPLHNKGSLTKTPGLWGHINKDSWIWKLCLTELFLLKLYLTSQVVLRVLKSKPSLGHT